MLANDNLLHIELVPVKLKSKFTKFQKIPIKIMLKNNDTSLTEKIIKYNIDFKNLKYKVVLTKLDDLDNVIRSQILNKFYANTTEKINYIDYTPKDFTIDFDFLESTFVYKMQVSLIEKMPYASMENQMDISNIIFVNCFYGNLTQKKVELLYKDRFKKEYFSKSEKDNIKVINNEIKLKNLEGIITNKDVKAFTYEGRTYDDLNQFLNSKNKASKLMTDKRKKKLIFSTETENHFTTKMIINNETKNPFLKNEWFMGPVYSYDPNYYKYE